MSLTQALKERFAALGIPANQIFVQRQANKHFPGGEVLQTAIQDMIIDEVTSDKYAAGPELARETMLFALDLYEKAGRELPEVKEALASQTAYINVGGPLERSYLHDALGFETNLRVAVGAVHSGRIPPCRTIESEEEKPRIKTVSSRTPQPVLPKPQKPAEPPLVYKRAKPIRVAETEPKDETARAEEKPKENAQQVEPDAEKAEEKAATETSKSTLEAKARRPKNETKKQQPPKPASAASNGRSHTSMIRRETPPPAVTRAWVGTVNSQLEYVSSPHFISIKELITDDVLKDLGIMGEDGKPRFSDDHSVRQKQQALWGIAKEDRIGLGRDMVQRYIDELGGNGQGTGASR